MGEEKFYPGLYSYSLTPKGEEYLSALRFKLYRKGMNKELWAAINKEDKRDYWVLGRLEVRDSIFKNYKSIDELFEDYDFDYVSYISRLIKEGYLEKESSKSIDMGTIREIINDQRNSELNDD